ncbi:hypothetical protein ASL19_12210 [Cylindrospermopsis sp. CR12]|nr:hypothetical protein ASL19_12210 [Cylindrospermopsis sp. CR12]
MVTLIEKLTKFLQFTMHNNALKISICIPTYNAEKFIRTTISSCLEQTQAPYEILLSDDGSSDRCWQSS